MKHKLLFPAVTCMLFFLAGLIFNFLELPGSRTIMLISMIILSGLCLILFYSMVKIAASGKKFSQNA
ncbi:hypothetical protein SAMN06265350_10152 [Solitalea koreensis]|uniref:Uncharacterized protein n=1 Tax=Solitalea koreensis TaxID=543615 RepID=A0A521ACH0_9SPHI|nr:hypothetical protein SAMN06265350_10152 [Solitalea koreensis]